MAELVSVCLLPRLGSDGSYIATEFFCILHVPVVPIKTLRVTPAPGQVPVAVCPEEFRAGRQAPLDFLQVISVYLVTIAVIAYGLSFFEFAVPWLTRRSTLMDNDWLEILAFGFGCLCPGFSFNRQEIERWKMRQRTYVS